MLAHIPVGDDAHGGIGAMLRLGPLLPLLLAGAVAALARVRGSLTTAAAAAVLAVGAAGVIHLALVGDHLADGVAAGGLFGAAGVGQVALAVGIAVQPGRPAWRRLTIVAAVVVTVSYVATRVTAVPLLGAREPVDALGVVTTALAVVAAAVMWPATGASRVVPDRRFVPLMVLAAVIVAPIAFDVDPTGAEFGVVGLVAVVVGVAGGVDRGRLLWLAAEAATIAVVPRGPVVVFVIAGVALGLSRALTTDPTFRWLPPASVALVIVLSVPLRARLDLLQVGHPDDVLAAVVLFVVSGAVAAAALARRRIGALWAAYGVLAVFETARLAAGTTSIESIEVFVTSPTLFVLVVAVLLGGPFEGRASIVAGAFAGASIGVLRSVEVAYPIPWGLLVGCAAIAAGGWVKARRRPLRPVRTARSSAATPRRT